MSFLGGHRVLPLKWGRRWSPACLWTLLRRPASGVPAARRFPCVAQLGPLVLLLGHQALPVSLGTGDTNPCVAIRCTNGDCFRAKCFTAMEANASRACLGITPCGGAVPDIFLVLQPTC